MEKCQEGKTSLKKILDKEIILCDTQSCPYDNIRIFKDTEENGKEYSYCKTKGYLQ